MEFENIFLNIFDREDFNYKSGDEETRILFQDTHSRWTEWCTELSKKNKKFDKPIVQAWQYGWGLHKTFWSRLKYIPYKNSAVCISLHSEREMFTIDLDYEFTNKNSEISIEDYCNLLLENVEQWSNKYKIDLNLFYIAAGKYKCTLSEYFSIHEKKNWFNRTKNISIRVGVKFDKNQILLLDTNSEKLIDILLKLSYLYEKIQKPNNIYEILKSSKELIPDEHDGSYELVRETTRAFKNIHIDELTFDDLDALFYTSVGTFRRSTSSKKELINKSNLPHNEKNRITNLMDRIDKDTRTNKYNNNHTAGHVGMFGVGFMTFNKKGSNLISAKQFIKLCADIVDIDDESLILNEAAKTLSNKITGIGISSVSTFLHCLKPTIFPIINGKEGQGVSTYEKLGIKLENPNDTTKYIKNLKIIRDYRNRYFEFKNYRVIDLVKANAVEPTSVYMDNRISEEEDSDNYNEIETKYVLYNKHDFFKDAFISEKKYSTIINRLRKKKNIILQGAPGVGKSYLAKKIAYSMIGKIDEDKVEMIQFHQSYSYEDFIMGYRPNKTGGFDIVEGVFYKFCKKAIKNRSEKYYFIIDEINRGNLSKIFGELMFLIECDKREESFAMSTVYSEEKLYIPDNLYIIGLMNTADRSIALIDYALRRRFSFVSIEPAFGERFSEYAKKFGETNLPKVLNIIYEINNDIEMDEALGKGFKIGHSYFCNLDEARNEELIDIIECDIIPLLEEYWIDNMTKVDNYAQRLNEAVGNE